jgi:hypothetical protein
VTDGIDTANIDFNGSYTLANFKFASDGSGGTIVYDPPVPTSNALAPTSSNQNTTVTEPQIGGTTGNNTVVAPGPYAALTGNAGNDQFVFNQGSGPHEIMNFSTLTDQSENQTGDKIELDHFINLLDTAHLPTAIDDGHGDSIIFQHLNASIIQAQAGHLFSA